MFFLLFPVVIVKIIFVDLDEIIQKYFLHIKYMNDMFYTFLHDEKYSNNYPCYKKLPYFPSIMGFSFTKRSIHICELEYEDGLWFNKNCMHKLGAIRAYIFDKKINLLNTLRDNSIVKPCVDNLFSKLKHEYVQLYYMT